MTEKKYTGRKPSLFDMSVEELELHQKMLKKHISKEQRDLLRINRKN